jgi:hypothetical protein
VLVAAFVVRAGYVLTLPDAPIWPDEIEYSGLAQRLADGAGFTDPVGRPTAYRPPGYPALLAAVFGMGGGVKAARLVQAVLGALTAAVVAAAAARRFGPRVGAAAGAIAAVYPAYVYTAGTLYPTTLQALLLTLIVVGGAPRAASEGAGRAGVGAIGRWAGLGAITGLLALVSPSGLAVLPALVWRERRRPALWGAAVLAAAVVIAPWCVRSTRTTGGPTLISTNGAQNLWLGYNPWATPSSGNRVGPSRDPELLRRVTGVGERDRAAAYREAALEAIAADPIRAVGLTVGKAVNLWRPLPAPATEGTPAKSGAAVAGAGVYLAVLGLALTGAVRGRGGEGSDAAGARGLIGWVGGVALAWTLVHAVTIAKFRLRLPLDASLVLLAAAGLAGLPPFRNRRGEPEPGA